MLLIMIVFVLKLHVTFVYRVNSVRSYVGVHI